MKFVLAYIALYRPVLAWHYVHAKHWSGHSFLTGDRIDCSRKMIGMQNKTGRKK